MPSIKLPPKPWLMASGGIDSTVMLYEMAAHGNLGGAIFCDYAQASAEHCRDLVQWHVKRLGVRMKVIKVDAPKEIDGEKLGVYQRGFKPKDKTFPPSEREGTQAEKTFMLKQWSWIEGRNALFFVQAGIFLSGLGVRALYTAFQFDDAYWVVPKAKRYKYDTGPDFVSAMNQLYASGAFINPIAVRAPYLDSKRDKADIVSIGKSLNVPFDKTHSCEFFPPCKLCNQCQVRASVLPDLTEV